MTVEVVAKFAGRPLVLDEALESRIADILRALMRRWGNRSFDAVRAANRKQALVPEGSHIIYPVGTAPGVVVPGKPAVVVLPGPPRELQPMWAEAVETDAFREATAGRRTYVQEMMRLFGLPESSMAETLRDAEGEIDGFDRLEITTCLRRAEVEVVTRYEPEDAGTYAALVDLISSRHPRELFSTDGSLVDDQVAALLSERRIATAESCTAGLVAARLTERPGSSGYFAGGIVAYANEVKEGLLDVDHALIERHGAVSPEVASAMAAGALSRFGADLAVSVTGVAGPGGGTEEKPVGTVCFCVRAADGSSMSRDVLLPGGRADIRERSTTVVMHMLRRFLRGEGESDA
jgi:nicotinamide-nucleotide amidase